MTCLSIDCYTEGLFGDDALWSMSDGCDSKSGVFGEGIGKE